MDLAEKRKHLMALRAAREQKQQELASLSRASENPRTAPSVRTRSAADASPEAASAAPGSTHKVGFRDPAEPSPSVQRPTLTGRFALARSSVAAPSVSAARGGDGAGGPERHPRQGLGLFNGWGSLAETADERGGAAAALCALTPHYVLPEGRVCADVTAVEVPLRAVVKQHGEGRAPHGGTAVCVVAAFASRSSAPDAVTAVAAPAETATGTVFTAASYQWGAGSAAGRAAAMGTDVSGARRGYGSDGVLADVRAAPGLALAWMVLPVPVDMSTMTGESAHDSGGGGSGSVDVVAVTPLVCDSEVLTVLAHPFRPGTILGGTRCGRIVAWTVGGDWCGLSSRQLRTRAMAATGTAHTLLLQPLRPAMSSFPSPLAHQGPVLAMTVNGDAGCHHLYSVSRDGKVVTWECGEELSAIATRTCALNKQFSGALASTATFAPRPGTDVLTDVYLGTTFGAVARGVARDTRTIDLQLCGPSTDPASAAGAPLAPSLSLARPGRSGSMQAATTKLQLEDHAAAVASGAARPAGGAPHGGGVVAAVAVQPQSLSLVDDECVISAATDGACFAWVGGKATPLEGFHTVVTSLQWSPTHPLIFAAGDDDGVLSFWHIQKSITTPLASVVLDPLLPQPLLVTAAAGDARTSGTTIAAVALRGKESVTVDMDGDEVPAAVGKATGAISCIRFSADGAWVFAGTASGLVYVVQLSIELY